MVSMKCTVHATKNKRAAKSSNSFSTTVLFPLDPEKRTTGATILTFVFYPSLYTI